MALITLLRGFGDAGDDDSLLAPSDDVSTGFNINDPANYNFSVPSQTATLAAGSTSGLTTSPQTASWTTGLGQVAGGILSSVFGSSTPAARGVAVRSAAATAKNNTLLYAGLAGAAVLAGVLVLRR